MLLASAAALAENKPKTEQTDGAAAARKKTETAHGATDRAKALERRQTEQTHAKTEPAQQGTKESQAKTEEAQGQAEKAQGQAEKAQAKPDEGVCPFWEIKMHPSRWSSFPGRPRNSATRRASRRCSTTLGSP
ncbi:MAG: hypothetical protein DMG61_02515 [Acidobacteria bacterium]|nr:MAG: hypothetical protein DMG61_02515 [Acidobacteriota bacterium]